MFVFFACARVCDIECPLFVVLLQAILARLQSSQPTYSYLKWEHEAEETDRRVEEISFYHRRPISAARQRSDVGHAAVPSVIAAASAASASGSSEAARRKPRPTSAPTYVRPVSAGRSRSGPSFGGSSAARPTSALVSRPLKPTSEGPAAAIAEVWEDDSDEAV